MKRYIKASELSGPKLDKYINDLKKMVSLDAPEVVTHIDWDMKDDQVIADVTFLNGDRHKFNFELWRFTQNPFYVSDDADMVLNEIKRYSKGMNPYDEDEMMDWDFIDSKQVYDFDGFTTDYTMWYDPAEDMWICILGDRDIYNPGNTEPDAEFETEREAYEWFDSYGEDEIVEESTRIRASQESDEFVDMGTGLNYWYFTTHGVMPGSIPKGLNIIKIIDKPEGTYFLTDRVLTTKSLKYYDIKERSPKGVIKASSHLNLEDRLKRIIVQEKDWKTFIDTIEYETGLKVDSAYRRRRKGENWLILLDESAKDGVETYEAEITEYSDGTYELDGDNIHRAF